MHLVSAANPQAIELFTGLSGDEFSELMADLEHGAGEEVADGLPGRQWSLPLADRVLLVACYYRTDATVRRLASLFAVTHSAAARILARLSPLLALQPLPQRRLQTERVLITSGGLALVTGGVSDGEGRDSAPGAVRVRVDVGTRLVLRVPLPQR
ncbi:transposase family protein [Actinomadura formosensis]|uniref:transposase family protein n=1 Tax=Actinomadura formosensis TaxID=60706 RepID=UPI003D943598